MGFRSGAFAKVWEVSPVSDTSTKVRLSVSRKNKQTDEYKQEFSGFVMFVGSACAAKALKLSKGARIKLGDVDVTTKYDADKKITYTNYKAFGFEEDGGGNSGGTKSAPDEKEVDDGEAEDRELPF